MCNVGDLVAAPRLAHSMGGLVVKAAYILARLAPDLRPLAPRISAILFLGTPHHGASIARILATLLALSSGPRSSVDDIVPGSVALQSISEMFPEVCGGLQLRSFFETRPVEVAGRKVLVVEKESAVLNLPNFSMLITGGWRCLGGGEIRRILLLVSARCCHFLQEGSAGVSQRRTRTRLRQSGVDGPVTGRFRRAGGSRETRDHPRLMRVDQRKAVLHCLDGSQHVKGPLAPRPARSRKERAGRLHRPRAQGWRGGMLPFLLRGRGRGKGYCWCHSEVDDLADGSVASRRCGQD